MAQFLYVVCLQDKAVQALRMTGNKSVEQAIEFLNQMKMIEGKNGINKAGKFRHLHMSLVMRNPVFGISDRALHKPGCTTTQDG